jgi:ABC-type transporter Mla subunit MlaD
MDHSDAKHNLERAVDNLQRLRREMPQRPNDADDELKALRRDQQQFIDKARKAKAEVVRQENLVKTLEDEMVAVSFLLFFFL